MPYKHKFSIYKHKKKNEKKNGNTTEPKLQEREKKKRVKGK